MNTIQRSGMYYQLDGPFVKFFDAMGMKLRDDTTILLPFGNNIRREFIPRLVISEFFDTISGEFDLDTEGRIAMVMLSPTTAVQFYLGDEFTAEHFQNAQEANGRIDIPNVEILGRTLTVRIDGNPLYAATLAGRDGEML